MASIEKRTLQNTIAGFLSFALSMVQSILLVPIFLRYWGEEKYAMWIALWAFVMLMRMLDNGFLSLIGNTFALAYHKNVEEAGKVLGGAVRISFALGVLELIAFLLLWATGLVESISGVPNRPNSMLHLAMFVAMIPWALGGSIMGVVLRAIPAMGLYSKMIYISMLMKIAEITILALAAIVGLELIYVSIMMALMTFIYAFVLNKYLHNIMPDFYPWWKSGTWSNGMKHFRLSLGLTANSFLEQYTNNGIIVLINKTIGLTMLPVFTTVRTLTNTATQATSIILDPLYPDIIRFHIRNEDNKITQLFLVNWLLINIIVNIPFAISILFIEYLYNIWTAHNLAFNAPLYYMLALTVSISTFGRPLTVFIRSLNLLRPINIISIARFLVTFGIAIPLISKYGIWILGGALLVAEIVCSIILPIIFTFRRIPSLSFSDMALGIAPTILLAVFFALEVLGFQVICSLLLFLALQFSVSYFQWNRLSFDAQYRIKALLRLH